MRRFVFGFQQHNPSLGATKNDLMGQENQGYDKGTEWVVSAFLAFIDPTICIYFQSHTLASKHRQVMLLMPAAFHILIHLENC